MTEPGFAEIAALVRRRAGIVLTEDKSYLLETRLGPVLQRFGLASLRVLGERLRAAPGEAMERAVVEALTTHESSFFRDGRPFEHLRALLPRLAARKAPGERVRVWSAACSTGQEPYSIAMLAHETLGAGAARAVEILGTDISGEVLARAREAAFSQFEVQRGLPIRALMTHFAQEGARWRLKPELRGIVRFEERNLMADCGALGRFDVIFCRNVLIYFDSPTKTRVMEMLARMLAPEGVLYLGAAETVVGLTTRLAPLPGERGVYGVSAQRAAA
ncbi:chemotaxis protein CheR [Falsiroseomonas bella]|uniref:protein-glutamate O-methyltransferase n=1 Tax=Falsiroseomonas bella TaxID=2184016 RepID=A0A317FC98_9PROT|nr:protein-glutamate O-methyltransferase CheR [Falsiroseomonas bella]PWS35569.1 chemotaxis protein CheR [Falsiroseomonas bella]